MKIWGGAVPTEKEGNIVSCARSEWGIESKKNFDAICWFPKLGNFLLIGAIYELNKFDLFELWLYYNGLDSNWVELDCVFEVP